MSPIHDVASTNEDLLQDPHLRIHGSTSLCLRLLCKIHVSGFMPQHPCVSQGPLQDPCCRIHSSAAICISGSQDPLQDPRLPIHVSASLYLTDALQDPRQRLRIHVSASLYLRIFCKIHVSGSMSPIQVSASMCISGTFRNLCKIHVSGSVYKHP